MMNCHSCGRNLLLLCLFIKQGIKVKLLWIISVDFCIIGYLLIKYSTFFRF